MQGIAKLYKRNAEDLGLFFYIQGLKKNFPTLKLDDAILAYFRFIEVDMDEWDLDSAKIEYNRISKEFYNSCREVTKTI